MATRGVNGAASGTLNERFIKCEGCRVNVPKEDMLSLGKCTVCGRVYEAVATPDGRGIQVATVAFAASGTAPTAEKKVGLKRWAVLQSKKGRTYYHNSETGEDRWDKPADLDADAWGATADLSLLCACLDYVVPFKNDAVKKAVLREQAKFEATKMGVPLEVVAATQQQLEAEDEANDPFSQMVNRGGKESATARQAAAPALSSHTEEEVGEAEEQHGTKDGPKKEGSCAVM
ncbi:hypothetical protein BBJ28_00008151 [Nothophytophthora sp. Chile5]|nr:hypothetical protein BBJ28_00008151 [Nothophytophthora sp. Chile5]